MKGESIKYYYNTNLEWIGEKKGILKCKGKDDIKIACPPEFGGHENIWSPEDLFLSSIEVCTMTTFLYLIKKEKINIVYYKSNADAIAELIKNSFEFSSIIIHMKIGVLSEKDKIKVNKIINKIPNLCIVSKSIKPNVILDAEFFLN